MYLSIYLFFIYLCLASLIIINLCTMYYVSRRAFLSSFLHTLPGHQGEDPRIPIIPALWQDEDEFQCLFIGWPLVGNEGMKPYIVMICYHGFPTKGQAVYFLGKWLSWWFQLINLAIWNSFPKFLPDHLTVGWSLAEFLFFGVLRTKCWGSYGKRNIGKNFYPEIHIKSEAPKMLFLCSYSKIFIPFFFCVKPSTSPFLHPSVFQQFFCNWTVLHGEKGSNRVPGRPTFSCGNRCCWMGVGNVEVGWNLRFRYV